MQSIAQDKVTVTKAKRDTPLEPLLGYRGLTAEQVQRIDLEIVKGTSAYAIVKIVQEELGACKDVKHHTLMKKITNYARHAGLEKKVLVAAARIVERKGGTKLLENFQVELNMQEELAEIFEAQKMRVSKAWEQEQKMPNGILLASLTDNIRLLQVMGKDLAHLHLQTGLLKQVPKKLEAEFLLTSGSRERLMSGKLLQQVVGSATAEALAILEEPIEGDYRELHGA